MKTISILLLLFIMATQVLFVRAVWIKARSDEYRNRFDSAMSTNLVEANKIMEEWTAYMKDK